LQAVADLTPETLRSGLDWTGYLPGFGVKQIDLAASYRQRCENIGKFGYGIYAKYHMFYVNPENKIVPVRNPDQTRLASLVDYEREKKIIVDNTLALLEGKPAANILLTGDAGTGKSSTVKAVVNELHERGLRILEVRKEQLHEIPAVLDELNSNPLKFILFIDDLSFQKDDDNFSALKAILEGSVSAKSQNVVIYATSNRRHLVKETFSDRDGDDIHRNDTMQEIISLSERFGIQITFQKPNKQTYLGIVRHLADERGVSYDPAQLEIEAERFALGRGGRSARAAKQFVDSLVAAQS
jgi:predicted AAA+ superfamily ATPase